MRKATTNVKINAIFLGTPDFAVPSLRALAKSENFNILGVFTEPDRPVGRKQILKEPSVKIIAKELGLKIFQPDNIKKEDWVEKIKKLNPDIAIIVAYGQIISKKILGIPRFGFINLHPSLLPKYRGPSPIQETIKNLDKKTGISIMLIDEEMDHGPILFQQVENIKSSETAESLHDKLSEIGGKLLIKTTENYIKGKIKPKEQNHKQTTFTKIIKREDGKIDWNKSAREIEALIRAYSPWPGTFTEIEGKRLKIKKASLRDNKLNLQKVQLEGKKEMDWEDFCKGNKNICEKIQKKLALS